ncbi:MAG TPA: hypothetical protein ENK31_01245, partial [Nannocystis exedens]|nr:hypothetical protein [Nannocystis exedens]
MAMGIQGRSAIACIFATSALVMSSGCDEIDPEKNLEITLEVESEHVELSDAELAEAEEIIGEMVYDEDLEDFVDKSDYDSLSFFDYIYGKYLFEKETFEGNGRTCVTCHTRKSGKISPSQIEALWAENPNAPLFHSIDSDDGVGNSFDRLRAEATVRVGITLPDGVWLVDDPAQDSVVFNRGIPSTLNTPSLDPVLMYDGRQPSLEAQA